MKLGRRAFIWRVCISTHGIMCKCIHLEIACDSPTPDASLNFWPMSGPYLSIRPITEDNFLQTFQGVFTPSFLVHLFSISLKQYQLICNGSLSWQISSPQFTFVTSADTTLYIDPGVIILPAGDINCTTETTQVHVQKYKVVPSLLKNSLFDATMYRIYCSKNKHKNLGTCG